MKAAAKRDRIETERQALLEALTDVQIILALDEQSQHKRERLKSQKAKDKRRL